MISQEKIGKFRGRGGVREREGGEKGVGVTGVTGVGILNAHCRTTPDGDW